MLGRYSGYVITGYSRLTFDPYIFHIHEAIAKTCQEEIADRNLMPQFCCHSLKIVTSGGRRAWYHVYLPYLRPACNLLLGVGGQDIRVTCLVLV